MSPFLTRVSEPEDVETGLVAVENQPVPISPSPWLAPFFVTALSIADVSESAAEDKWRRFKEPSLVQKTIESICRIFLQLSFSAPGSQPMPGENLSSTHKDVSRR